MNRQQALEGHVRELSLPAGRRVGQPGHDRAREYLVRQMQSLGLWPFRGDSYQLPYSHGGQGFTNVVGRIAGREGALPPVLIGAHYDSAIDGPSSDDNAAAVAIALEAGRAVSLAPLRRDVIVALFDAEEPPFFQTPAMGSLRFYEDHCRGMDLACAIIMDLVGHDVEALAPGLERLIPELRRFLFVMGSETRSHLPGAVAKAAGMTPRLRIVPALHDYVGDMSDHYAFRIAGKPFLFLSCGQGRFYHSTNDTPDWLNFEKVHDTCDFVLNLTRALDETEAEVGGSSDTVQFEIEMIERATGLSRAQLARVLGLDALRTRSDLNRLAALLSSRLLVWAQEKSQGDATG